MGAQAMTKKDRVNGKRLPFGLHSKVSLKHIYFDNGLKSYFQQSTRLCFGGNISSWIFENGPAEVTFI